MMFSTMIFTSVFTFSGNKCFRHNTWVSRVKNEFFFKILHEKLKNYTEKKFKNVTGKRVFYRELKKKNVFVPYTA